jgi:hypothetical protein
MSTFGVATVFRSLARLRRLQLALLYIAAATAATALFTFGRLRRIPAAQTIGALIGLVSISVFVSVATFYRNDAIPQAAFLLSVTTALSYSAGLLAVLLVMRANAGMAAILFTGSLLGLPVRILILTIVFGALVAVGRRFRRYLAPQTAADGPTK